MKLTKAQISEIRYHTMACWWPSRVTNKIEPDWEGIAMELEALSESSAMRNEYSIETHALRGLHKLALGSTL